jgi:hypothetical protein
LSFSHLPTLFYFSGFSCSALRRNATRLRVGAINNSAPLES